MARRMPSTMAQRAHLSRQADTVQGGVQQVLPVCCLLAHLRRLTIWVVVDSALLLHNHIIILVRGHTDARHGRLQLRLRLRLPSRPSRPSLALCASLLLCVLLLLLALLLLQLALLLQQLALLLLQLALLLLQLALLLLQLALLLLPSSMANACTPLPPVACWALAAARHLPQRAGAVRGAF